MAAANTSGDVSMPDAAAIAEKELINDFLERFRVAHKTGAGNDGIEYNTKTFETAVTEMRQGVRNNLWHYHILPSMKVTEAPHNPDAFYFENFDQIRAYILDPTLGFRLGYLFTVILEQTPAGVSAQDLMATEDAVTQFHSCVTLIHTVMGLTDVEPHDYVKQIPGHILKKFFGGLEKVHWYTVETLEKWTEAGESGSAANQT
ncbi:hypothetical protein QBC38DRAFT_270122 [Podospora fimiseda]|uniref:Uncharacterized protein n=1 Tax=Podospora fimiseda TaxID=252190 RepID=A0AAN7BKV8_9PEZI|nr:hypothetical protein QBC38DRAFT_270122 [Podospora fimiseda]